MKNMYITDGKGRVHLGVFGLDKEVMLKLLLGM
jgi:hypothetical protein